jgi:hypothetical protein
MLSDGPGSDGEGTLGNGLVRDQCRAHGGQDAGDCLLCLRESNELDSDSEAPVDRRRNILDFAFDSNGDGTVIARKVDRDAPALQVVWLRALKCDTKSEHRDINNPTVSPTDGIPCDVA